MKMGISGIRGITGETLTDAVARDLAKAFAAYLGKGAVVIGRDSRPSGKTLEKIVMDELLASGINVVYAGLAATPTMQVLVKELKAKGGIVITASHNPIEWNGFKFISGKGVFLNAEQNGKLFDIYFGKKFRTSGKRGKLKVLKNADDLHIDAVLKAVDLKKIRSKKFRVALDSCNGAGSRVTPKLLKKLGCRIIELNTDPEMPFPHGTEPTPDNLTELMKKVMASKADVGFAQDPDADRLSIVTDKGVAIGEEFTMVLAAMQILKSEIRNTKSEKGRIIVTNLSTSRMIEDVAKEFGAKVIRTRVGEINVVEELVRSKALLAGEGNGGVIYPKVVSSRDSLTGMALILNLMADEGKSISGIAEGIPKYTMIKTKISCSSKDEAEKMAKRAKSRFGNAKLDERDGVKAVYRDSWIHVRASNTEPVLRIIAEARTRRKAEELIRKIS